MLDRIVSDFVKGIIPGAQGAAQAGLAVMDVTFSSIFQAIQDTGAKLEDEANHLFNPRKDDKSVNGEQVVYAPSPDENVTDTKTTTPKDNSTEAAADAAAYAAASAAVKETAPVAPKPGEAINKEEVKKVFAAMLKKLSGREGELTEEELKKIDRLANLLTAKLNELAARDPGQFDKLMEKFSGMTMRDVARELDLSLRASEKLAGIVDLDQPIANSFEEGKLDKLIARLAAAQLNGAQAHKNEPASSSGEQPFSDALKESKSERAKTPATQNAEGKNSQTAGQQQGRAQGAEAYAAAQESAQNHSARGGAAKAAGAAVEMGSAAHHTHGKSQPANAGAVKTAHAPRGEFDRSLIDQIVKNARFSTRANGVSNMVIHLEPAHLGKVNMKVTVQDNVVKALLIAENPEVRGAIEANLEALRASLQGQGLKVDQIVVASPETGLDGRGQSFAQQFDQAGGGEGGHDAYGSTSAAEGEEAAAASIESNTAVEDGALHVIA